MKYAETRFMNNVNCDIFFEGVGEYGIPEIFPEAFIQCEFIPFSEMKTCKTPYGKGIHFFIDDYRFERVWHNWRKYANELSRFQAVMTPDFSMYTDFPIAVQIWNHYRKHFIGAYLQNLGIRVYPTICWSDEKSFDFCFDGEPVNSCVCVSSVGTQKTDDKKRKFLFGYDAMLERLQPETVIFYGDVPRECRGNICRIKPFQEKFKEVRICEA